MSALMYALRHRRRIPQTLPGGMVVRTQGSEHFH